jgi:hypothetical protein
MLLTSITRRVSKLFVVSLLPMALALGEAPRKTDVQKEAVQLIGKLEGVSRDIRNHADRLESLKRDSLISPLSHHHHLGQIKELVNDGLNPTLVRLTALQPELPAWKQQAIDEIVMRAKALAADTNAAINNKNETKYLPAALNYDYAALVASINEHAQALVATSDAAGTYAKAYFKASEAGLDLPQY